MSEKVTHTAVMDDCFRLALASGELCTAFGEAMEAHWSFARLGSGTRAGDRHSVRLLSALRERWSGRTPGDNLEAKLAFVLGWLCHRAADRQMKPVFRQVEPNATQKPTECSVYHDAFLFREVYARDSAHTYTHATFEADLTSLPAAEMLDVAQVRELFHTLLQQSLVEIHTFDPDEAHIERWLDGLAGLQQRFYVDVERYARAVAEPEPGKVRQFITETNFYDAHDPIVAAASVLRRREAIPVTKVSEAIRADAGSHYARALRMGCGYLVAASEFFVHDIDADELRDRLDIGRPGRDGKSV